MAECSILILSNLAIEFGRPSFRAGAYNAYLGPLANALTRSDKEVTCTILAGDHLTYELAKLPEKLNDRISLRFVPTNELIGIFGAGDLYQDKMYCETWSEADAAAYAALFGRFLDKAPDIILCWESPTNLMRRIFPSALVVDLMPGIFMRPPFPRTIQLDVCGLYRHSMLRQIPTADFQSLSDGYRYDPLKNAYSEFFHLFPLDTLSFCGERTLEQFDKVVLLPLQITSHFGFRLNSSYPSQFDFMIDTLHKTPENVGVIVTQYVSNLISETAVTDANIDFLVRNYKNFLFSKSFTRMDSTSQYIIPHVDGCISVSSTLGLQAAFFDKPLLCAGDTQLNAFGTPLSTRAIEQTVLADVPGKGANTRAAMRFLLSRATLPVDAVTNGSLDFAAHLRKLHERRNEERIIDRTVPIASPERTNLLYAVMSNFSAAHRNAEKLHGEALPNAIGDSPVRGLFSHMDSVDVISFDVFDTLIERVVFHPKDVFLFVERSVVAEGFPEAAGFARLREEAERAIRRSFDFPLQPRGFFLDGIPVAEEMAHDQIYTVLQRIAGYSDALTERLKEREYDLEMRLTRPRAAGRFLFDAARTRNKRVIGITDTSLPKSYMLELLKRHGYVFDQIFVSSDVNLKKHNGKIFPHVIRTLNVDPARILHIGDNIHGDIKYPQELGIRTFLITQAKEETKGQIEGRGLDYKAVIADFALRSHIGLYAQMKDRILAPKTLGVVSSHSGPNLCESAYEIGYFALAPIIYAFTRHLLATASQSGVDFLGFLARDCWPFYEFARYITEKTGDRSINIQYIYASRASMATTGLQGVSDVHRVRLDDFARQRSLGELLSSRFMLPASAVPAELLTRWGIASLDERVATVPEFAIRALVREAISGGVPGSAAGDTSGPEAAEEGDATAEARTGGWSLLRRFLAKVGDRDEDLVLTPTPAGVADDEKPLLSAEGRQHFLDQLSAKGFDAARKPVLVDFGYKGTIHRAVEAVTGRSVGAAFFAAYNDEFGRPDLPELTTFFGSINANLKAQSDFLRYSLIVETLLNKAEGSATSFNPGGTANTEDVASVHHYDIISAIHSGGLQGARALFDAFDANGMPLTFSPETALFPLFQLLREPSLREAELLGDVVFDNVFAGARPRTLISPPEADASTPSIWREGELAIRNQMDYRLSRRSFFKRGMAVYFRHNDRLVYTPSFADGYETHLLFGFSRLEKVPSKSGERINIAWACEEVVGFAIVNTRGDRHDDSPDGTLETVFLAFKQERITTADHFTVYQNDIALKTSIMTTGDEECRLVFQIDVTRPFFVRKTGWRKPARDTDERHLYWQFRGLHAG